MFRILLFIIQSVAFGLAFAFLLLVFAPDSVDRLRSLYGRAPLPNRSTLLASYSPAVERAAPAVVNIYANKIITERPVRLIPNPYLQRFSGLSIGPPRQRLEQSLGSGVIVTPQGHLLTNHHLIAGADDIQAVLPDGRTARAQLVGSDPETDLAVLKLEGEGYPFLRLDPTVPFRVGDVALAIGNPFGMGQSVTLGIIGATGRNQLNLLTYEDFIQTDAAINTGNSGGALINADGRLIGINTAILGRGTGAEGIGFAIPVRIAAMVLEQILEHGYVVRGWLGIEYVDAAGLAPGMRGVAVVAVHPGGPAASAGLRPGDLLLALDGREIIDQHDLRIREASLAPGAPVEIGGLRGGVPFRAALTLAQRPPPRRLG
ncbi:MAG: AlgW protein [Lysobacterales bacterium]|nr:MAG: AlgW protein [Xanthomonadales bacterium]